MSAEQPKRWMCRKRVEMDSVIRNGQSRNKVIAELVWGRWEDEKKHENGQISPAQIVGESYHQLNGPTAESSIQSFAEDLNMRNVPPTKLPSFKKPSNRRNDPNQPFLSLTGEDLGKTKPKK